MTTGEQAASGASGAATRAALLRRLLQRFGLRVSKAQEGQLDGILGDILTRGGRAEASLEVALADGGHPGLLEELATRLTIQETHFFRVEPQIEALRKTILPDLIRRRAAERRLRLWSAGCSTGEEPYTLAILVREQLTAIGAWDVDILATDLSRPALELARRALYPAWSFRGTPERVRGAYFAPEGRSWRLIEGVRRMVRFEQHNLAIDPLPSPGGAGDGFDLVLCRNVTIYFDRASSQRLYRRFAEALSPGGWLVLGPSDPAPERPEGLTPTYLPGAVLWRRDLPAAEAAAPHPRPRSPPATPNRPEGATAVAPTRGKGAVRAAPPPLPALEEIWRLAHAGESRAARVAVERLAVARPLEVEAHLLLGMLWLDEGAAQSAFGSLRRAVFLEAQNPLAHFGLGRALLRLGDRARARTALVHARRLLAGAPADGLVPRGGGMRLGDLRRAVDAQIATLGRAAEGAG
ncbi:MAG TPA: CheR family methyltransferase [Chloroflexota bacterium]|jgi:chemotaxis protein methyltransferase CheR